VAQDVDSDLLFYAPLDLVGRNDGRNSKWVVGGRAIRNIKYVSVGLREEGEEVMEHLSEVRYWS
jgi:hypothetical protein